MPFEEIAFFIAMIGVVVVYFAAARVASSASIDLDVQASTGMKMEHEEHKVFWNPLLVGSILYMLVATGLTVVAYREYF